MSGIRQSWFAIVSVAAILALAAYGIYASYDPSRSDGYEERLSRYDESIESIDTLDPDALALLEAIYSSPGNKVLSATADWVSAWFRAEPIGATFVISLAVVALCGLLLVPFLVWSNFRRLREIADNQRIQIRLLNKAINETEFQDKRETTFADRRTTRGN